MTSEYLNHNHYLSCIIERFPSLLLPTTIYHYFLLPTTTTTFFSSELHRIISFVRCPQSLKMMFVSTCCRSFVILFTTDVLKVSFEVTICNIKSSTIDRNVEADCFIFSAKWHFSFILYFWTLVRHSLFFIIEFNKTLILNLSIIWIWNYNRATTWFI